MNNSTCAVDELVEILTTDVHSRDRVVSGRATLDARKRYNRLRATTAEAAFTDFFSGRVVKEDEKYKLVSDDPAQEEAFYRRITANYNAGVRAEQQRALNFALGAVVGMLMLGGAGGQLGNPPIVP
jgi:hypothetical protein